MHGAEETPADANDVHLFPRTDTDAEVLAERGRKGRQPAYVPLLHGHRLGEMQDVLMDSILQTMDEFHVCRSPQCVFASRAEYWVRNMLLAGGPTACPVCGERLRPCLLYTSDAADDM
eukprot:15075231-Alexandrium_andersonii.AAC.1